MVNQKPAENISKIVQSVPLYWLQPLRLDDGSHAVQSTSLLSGKPASELVEIQNPEKLPSGLFIFHKNFIHYNDGIVLKALSEGITLGKDYTAFYSAGINILQGKEEMLASHYLGLVSKHYKILKDYLKTAEPAKEKQATISPITAEALELLLKQDILKYISGLAEWKMDKIKMSTIRNDTMHSPYNQAGWR